jgi:hypothetical protein
VKTRTASTAILVDGLQQLDGGDGMIVQSEWERHASVPEPDGGIVWFRRPIFGRSEHWQMKAAARKLGELAAAVDTYEPVAAAGLELSVLSGSRPQRRAQVPETLAA